MSWREDLSSDFERMFHQGGFSLAGLESAVDKRVREAVEELKKDIINEFEEMAETICYDLNNGSISLKDLEGLIEREKDERINNLNEIVKEVFG